MTDTLHQMPAALPIGRVEREPTLSTRAMSYTNNAPLISPNLMSSQRALRNRFPMSNSLRQNTLESDSDSEVSMPTSREQEMRDAPELPDSVAQSPLFTLPREIRDRIYTFCLVSEAKEEHVVWPTKLLSLGLQAQILQTCRIVYNEAAPLLYTANTICFHHPSDANMFVRALSSPILSRHIVNLQLHIKAQDMRLWMPYLNSTDSKRSLKYDFPNLRELSIRFRSNRWQHSLPPESNLKIWSSTLR